MSDIVERLREWSTCNVFPEQAQYAVSAACLEITSLRAEIERLRAALELYREAVRIDATMEGPKFMGSNASALKRAWEADLVALGGKDE